MELPATPDCLCLICRQTGHIVEKCSQYTQWVAQVYDSDPLPPVKHTEIHPIPLLNPLPTLEERTLALCERCSKLDGILRITTHRPFVAGDFEENHSGRATKKTTQLPSLGPILSLRLLSTCPLCRFLFDISYVAKEDVGSICFEGELVQVIAWTTHRFEGYLCWDGDERGKGPYAKCIYTSVTASDRPYEPAHLVEDAVDAFGFVDITEGASNDVNEPALGVRPVDPKTPDYGIIKGWLRRCDDLHHTACRPVFSDSLEQIKLINVDTREVVVYPINGCDYVALSYVCWSYGSRVV